MTRIYRLRCYNSSSACVIFLATACASLLLWDGSCHAWTLQSARRIARASCWKKQPFSNLPTRLLEKQQSEEEDSSGKKKSTFTTTVLLEEQADAALLEDEDMEGPAIEGSQFFGGNKQKVEFYDPIAEATAGTEFLEAVASNRTLFNRFADRRAFETNKVADLAQQLQQRINQILYPDEQTDIQGALKYSSKLQWVTPLARKGNNDPLDELRSSRDFYRFVDLAITGGRSASNDRSGVSSFELRWELAVEWPTVWEPRILLTGTTMLDMSPSGNEIIRQVDALDHPSSDLFACIRDQILPRFWDVYHIGMTPSAELSPTIPEKTSSLATTSRAPPRSFAMSPLKDLYEDFDAGRRNGRDPSPTRKHELSSNQLHERSDRARTPVSDVFGLGTTSAQSAKGVYSTNQQKQASFIDFMTVDEAAANKVDGKPECKQS